MLDYRDAQRLVNASGTVKFLGHYPNIDLSNKAGRLGASQSTLQQHPQHQPKRSRSRSRNIYSYRENARSRSRSRRRERVNYNRGGRNDEHFRLNSGFKDRYLDRSRSRTRSRCKSTSRSKTRAEQATRCTLFIGGFYPQPEKILLQAITQALHSFGDIDNVRIGRGKVLVPCCVIYLIQNSMIFAQTLSHLRIPK